MSEPLFTEKEIAQLHQAYQDAIYEVYYCEQTITLFIDQLNPELDLILEKYHCLSWALITAHNPYSQCLSTAENQQRHQNLIELVRLRCRGPFGSQDLIFFNAVGKDKDGVWTPEQSLFIVGIKLEHAVTLGNKFQQNAIVWGKLKQASQLIWL